MAGSTAFYWTWVSISAGGGWVALLRLTGLEYWFRRGWLVSLPCAMLGFWSRMRGWLGKIVAFYWPGASGLGGGGGWFHYLLLDLGFGLGKRVAG